MRKAFLVPVLFIFLCSCALNNVKTDDDLKKYFDEYHVDGSFAMFDNSRGQHTIYNGKRDTTRFMPASTFKIVNALIALQTGRLTTDSSIITLVKTVKVNGFQNVRVIPAILRFQVAN